MPLIIDRSFAEVQILKKGETSPIAIKLNHGDYFDKTKLIFSLYSIAPVYDIMVAECLKRLTT